jgi:hypothetical protein
MRKSFHRKDVGFSLSSSGNALPSRWCAQETQFFLFVPVRPAVDWQRSSDEKEALLYVNLLLKHMSDRKR